MNQRDARGLLIADEWPEDYFDENLIKQAELIMQEFEQLRGDNTYSRFIKDKDLDLNKECKLTILKGVLKLFYLNKPEALKVIEACGFKYKTIEEVDRAIKQREFDLQVEEIKKGNKPETKITFEEIFAPIATYFKLPFDRNITVSYYLALEKQYKSALKAEKKTA